MELNQLSYRANVNAYSFEDKTVLLYEDHRTLLNTLFFARKHDLLDSIPNVISFDYHDDALSPKASLIEFAETFDINGTSERDFNSVVEFDMSIQDDDWVKAGMELGLINNSLVIGAVETQNIGGNHSDYPDHKGGIHNLYSIPHLSRSLAERGALGDSQIKYDYYKEVRELLNFNTQENPNRFGKKTPTFILDFDLDCFSTEVLEKQMAWPESLFRKELHTPIGWTYNSPYLVIKELIKRCKFVTICVEAGCCGGRGEAHKILCMLDENLFEGSLTTKTVY